MARPRITPLEIRRALRVARIVVPVVTPFAIRGVRYARYRWDTARARRLGVGLDELQSFSGRGSALHARLSRLAMSLHELAERRPDAAAFVRESDERLVDLSAAVRAAELMPTARRRAAHKAVAAELDVLEAELLRRLGVTEPR
jgi:hypothetical protein